MSNDFSGRLSKETARAHDVVGGALALFAFLVTCDLTRFHLHFRAVQKLGFSKSSYAKAKRTLIDVGLIEQIYTRKTQVGSTRFAPSRIRLCDARPDEDYLIVWRSTLQTIGDPKLADMWIWLAARSVAYTRVVSEHFKVSDEVARRRLCALERKELVVRENVRRKDGTFDGVRWRAIDPRRTTLSKPNEHVPSLDQPTSGGPEMENPGTRMPDLEIPQPVPPGKDFPDAVSEPNSRNVPIVIATRRVENGAHEANGSVSESALRVESSSVVTRAAPQHDDRSLGLFFNRSAFQPLLDQYNRERTSAITVIQHCEATMRYIAARLEAGGVGQFNDAPWFWEYDEVINWMSEWLAPLDDVIIPTVARLISRGKTISSWRYFSDAIGEANAKYHARLDAARKS